MGIFDRFRKEIGKDDAFAEAERRIEEAKRKGNSFLDLSGLGLEALPESISGLSKLRELALSKNQLSDVSALSGLSQLRVLNLFNNALSNVSALSGLSQLRELDLDNNQLSDVSALSGLSGLSKLRELWLQNNQLSDVSALSGLSQLRELWLSNNALSDVSALSGLSQLQRLEIEGNPLSQEIQKAFNRQSLKKFLEFLQRLAVSGEGLNEGKLILVGEGDVGKSSLLASLCGEEWVENRSSTHGVEIKPVSFDLPEQPGRQLTLNAWDFGGQTVYRPTHQFFFTAPAIYLVLWKPRDGWKSHLVTDWLKLIKHRAPGARVLIVATHGGPNTRQPDVNTYEIKKEFGEKMILGFYHVESKPDPETKAFSESFTRLKTDIAKLACDLPGFSRKLPAGWVRLYETIKVHEAPYLTQQDFQALIDQQEGPLENLSLYLETLNELGHIIHFPKDKALQDYVILKPDWLAKAISYVLDNKALKEKHGLASQSDLATIWSTEKPDDPKAKYDEQLHPVFIRLMERFELAYKVKQADTEKQAWLIAQMVNDEPPEFEQHWQDSADEGETQKTQICKVVEREEGESANAEGLFYRLIVRLHPYSLGRASFKDSIHWQKGLLLKDGHNGTARLEHIDHDIHITVRAAYPETFLARITYEVREIVEEFWKGLKVEIMVPCLAPCGLNSPGKGLFQVSKLIEYQKEYGIDLYPCEHRNCRKAQSIPRLLANAPINPYPQPDPASQSDRISWYNEQEQKIEQLFEAQAAFFQSHLASIQTLQAADQGTFQDKLESFNSKLDTILENQDQHSQDHKAILSENENHFNSLMRALADGGKEGPRLFTLMPLKTSKKFSWKGITQKRFRITLWCEHARVPVKWLYQADDPNNEKGVYELSLSKKWVSKTASHLKIINTGLKLILQPAMLAIGVFDPDTFQSMTHELKFGESLIKSVAEGADQLGSQAASKSAPDFEDWDNKESWERGLHSHKDWELPEFHNWLRDYDRAKNRPVFDGLSRVSDRNGHFRWVHPQFEDLDQYR